MEEKNRELELNGKKIEDEAAGGAAGGLGNIIETKKPDSRHAQSFCQSQLSFATLF